MPNPSKLHGPAWRLGVLLTLCAACPGRPTPPTVPPTNPDVPDHDETTSSPDGTAALDLPSWMAPLFDATHRRRYSWEFEVDVHDEAGSVARAEGTLTCAVRKPQRHELADGPALTTCEQCEYVEASSDDEGFAPDLDDCYVATESGLWIVDAVPADDAELERLVATPPYLATEPVAMQQGEPGDGMTPGDGMSIASPATNDDGEQAWCRDDSSSEMYGSSTTRCFEPGVGLYLVDMVGREGPSMEMYELAVDPKS